MAFIVECCNRLFRYNQTVLLCLHGYSDVSITLSKSIKSKPLYTTDVDSMELADWSVRVG